MAEAVKPRLKPWPARFVFGYRLAREGFKRSRMRSIHSAWILNRPWWLSQRARAAKQRSTNGR
jgi:hypothetical protein